MMFALQYLRLLYISSCVLLAISTHAHAEDIVISGSTTLLPAIQDAAHAFEKAYPQHELIVSGGGSGVGITTVLQHHADIGMLSRPLSLQEQQKASETILIPIAYDAIALGVSQEVYNSGVQQISVEQLRQIWLGNINFWDELGGFHQPILLLDENISHGTPQSFRTLVFGKNKTLTPGVDLIAPSNDAMHRILYTSDRAMAAISLAHIKADIPVLKLLEHNKLIKPTIRNIQAARYPLMRTVYLFVRKEQKQSIQQFLDFILSDKGQFILQNNGLIPLETLHHRSLNLRPLGFIPLADMIPTS